MAAEESGLLKPGDLAKQFDVTIVTLRNWEREGHIPSSIRTPGGHRRFTKEHVAAIQRYLGQPADSTPPANEPR